MAFYRFRQMSYVKTPILNASKVDLPTLFCWERKYTE
jgi:hypothetical protein